MRKIIASIIIAPALAVVPLYGEAQTQDQSATVWLSCSIHVVSQISNREWDFNEVVYVFDKQHKELLEYDKSGGRLVANGAPYVVGSETFTNTSKVNEKSLSIFTEDREQDPRNA